jgi:hypothetical protein
LHSNILYPRSTLDRYKQWAPTRQSTRVLGLETSAQSKTICRNFVAIVDQNEITEPTARLELSAAFSSRMTVHVVANIWENESMILYALLFVLSVTRHKDNDKENDCQVQVCNVFGKK